MKDNTSPTNDGRLPWRPHHPDDHARYVKGWPAAARTALIEFLDHQWMNDALPDDQDRLRAIAALTPREWSIAWPFVEADFPICADGLRRNDKLTEQKTAQLLKHERYVANGSKGGKTKAMRLMSSRNDPDNS
jgi:uncharacterized protein YdaU (DUF1376 family)